MNFDTSDCRVAVIGRGRLGHLLARSLGTRVVGPDEPADVVLLSVPDRAIAEVAAKLAPGPIVGHCSGALELDVLAPHLRRFSMHPADDGHGPDSSLHGAGAAVAGSDEAALDCATQLATTLGMQPFAVADRAAYHAAASFASNFLITLEAAAEELSDVPRELLVPLVRATVENWATRGPREALTGPIARGDEATVARQREAVSRRAPQLLTLFDELCTATRELAHREAVAA